MLVEILPLTDIMQFIDHVGEGENDAEADKGSSHPIQCNVYEVLEELFLFEVVAPRENHGRQQCIEEEFLVELYFREIVEEVHSEPEDEADDDSDAGFVDDMDLRMFQLWVHGDVRRRIR